MGEHSIVGWTGGRARSVFCVGTAVEKLLPEMQGRDWWGGCIQPFLSCFRWKSKAEGGDVKMPFLWVHRAFVRN